MLLRGTVVPDSPMGARPVSRAPTLDVASVPAPPGLCSPHSSLLIFRVTAARRMWRCMLPAGCRGVPAPLVLSQRLSTSSQIMFRG